MKTLAERIGKKVELERIGRMKPEHSLAIRYGLLEVVEMLESNNEPYEIAGMENAVFLPLANNKDLKITVSLTDRDYHYTGRKEYYTSKREVLQDIEIFHQKAALRKINEQVKKIKQKLESVTNYEELERVNLILEELF